MGRDRRVRGLQWGLLIGSMLTGGTLILLTRWAAFPAQAQPPAPIATPSPAPVPKLTVKSTSRPLRIATRLARPDAFEENGQIVGFSVDLGRSVLAQLQRQPEVKTYATVPDVLAAIRYGQADLGIAAIAITTQREREFDFSYPILVDTLQIMVLRPEKQARIIEQELIKRLLDPNLLRLAGIIALLMLVPAHILWYVERKNKDGLIHNQSYIPGFFQALWWTILALIGQTDEMPNGLVGKIVGLFWVMVGIVFIAYFTATITAELTVQEIRGNVQDLKDLRDRPVALVADDEAVQYLEANGIEQVTKFDQFEPAYAALLAKQVDAIIASRPLLLYYAHHQGQGQVQVVGTPFREKFYAIVMPENSPYRKSVNRAILTLKENGTYRDIYRKWIGINPAN